ncbi:MAG: hypothetical protein ACTS6J_24585, partial [Burkholderiales bacterium]
MKLTHDAIERNVGLMIVLTILVVSVGGLLEKLSIHRGIGDGDALVGGEQGLAHGAAAIEALGVVEIESAGAAGGVACFRSS